MSDLISRQAARNAVRNLGEDYVARLKMLLLIEELPSAEPERTAKVIHRQETHIVTPPKSTTAEYKTETNLWTECGNCGAKGMYHGWNYCPKCGVKLDWSGNE